MTKTHKAVSDLLAQHSEQCSKAIEIDETETRKLYYMTSRILRKSVERIKLKSALELIGFRIGCFINKKEFRKLALPYKDKNYHLEKSLDDAIKRIQKTNAKKMFLVIKMNMKYGPEKTIDYIIKSFEKTESIEINGMTFLVGEARKVP